MGNAMMRFKNTVIQFVTSARTALTSVTASAPVASAPVASAPVASAPVASAYCADIELAVDQYVERWFDQNPSVNIGLVDVPLLGSVDLLPNSVEKRIYKRLYTVLLTNMLQTEIQLLGVPLQLRPIVPDVEEEEESEEVE